MIHRTLLIAAAALAVAGCAPKTEDTTPTTPATTTPATTSQATPDQSTAVSPDIAANPDQSAGAAELKLREAGPQ